MQQQKFQKSLNLFSIYIISMKKNLSVANISSNQSLAHKYGIAFKENCSVASMGMNPNLNVEDEYIQNLLKQIHFMNMEVKLIKEKQQASGQNALWSLINRSNEPMMSNIVHSTKKYQNLRQKTTKEINHLEHLITNLDNSYHSLISQLSTMEARHKILDSEIDRKLSEGKQRSDALNCEIAQNKKKFENLQKEKKSEDIKKNELLVLLSSLENQAQKDNYNREREIQAIRNEELIEEKMEADIVSRIQEMNSKIGTLKKLFEGNIEYVQAAEEKNMLSAKIQSLDKNIISTNFELMQLNESLKMAEQQKQKQIRERKKITQNLQQNKMILFSILQMNLSRKDKESEHRKKQSPEIKRAEQQKFKLKRNLQDIKKKLAKASENENSIHSEVHNLQLTLTNTKSIHSVLLKSLSGSLNKNSEKQSQWLNLQNELSEIEDRYKKCQQQGIHLSREELGLSRQVEYLRKKNEKLREKVAELSHLINSLRVQDLSKAVKKNEDFNRTVDTLMSKWTQIQDFGRM